MREPGVENGGSVAVTITAAMLLTRKPAGGTLTPILRSRFDSDLNREQGLLAVAGARQPDHQAIADQQVVAHAFDRDQVFETRRSGASGRGDALPTISSHKAQTRNRRGAVVAQGSGMRSRSRASRPRLPRCRWSRPITFLSWIPAVLALPSRVDLPRVRPRNCIAGSEPSATGWASSAGLPPLKTAESSAKSDTENSAGGWRRRRRRGR